MKTDTVLLALLGACAGAVAAAPPQLRDETHVASLTTHSVFKCDMDGRTLYTDRPCRGARSVQPIALDGIARTEDHPTPAPPARETLALEGQRAGSPGEAAPRAYFADPHRLQFGAASNPACPHLAQRMGWVEAEARRASSQTRPLIEERLSIQRQRYRSLGC
jgi:hypothetical protein